MTSLSSTAAAPSGKLLYSIKEAADALALSAQTVYDLCDAEKIPTVRQGRRRYITATALHEYVANLPSVVEEDAS